MEANGYEARYGEMVQLSGGEARYMDTLAALRMDIDSLGTRKWET